MQSRKSAVCFAVIDSSALKMIVSDGHARRNALGNLQTSSHYALHSHYSAKISEMGWGRGRRVDGNLSKHGSRSDVRLRYHARLSHSDDIPLQILQDTKTTVSHFTVMEIHLPQARWGGGMLTNEPESDKKQKNKTRTTN